MRSCDHYPRSMTAQNFCRYCQYVCTPKLAREAYYILLTRKSSCVNARGTPRSRSKCLLFRAGGVPGSPPRRWGTPPVQGWGTPPCPRLGYPPVQGWIGVPPPPVQGCIRVPPPHPRLDQVPPLPRTGMDRDGVTPPPKKSEQTDISKYNKESHHMSVVPPPPPKVEQTHTCENVTSRRTYVRGR